MSLFTLSGEVDVEGGALVSGAFYWVIPAYCPVFEPVEEWYNLPQPARYDGNGHWDSLMHVDGECSPDWPIVQIGKRIYPVKSQI
jgi:hypothetical protein